MDIFKNLIDISSENGKIHKFFEYTKNINDMIGCDKKTDCDIFKFLKPLEEVLFDSERYGYDHQRTFFIDQCMRHPDVFYSMFQLRTKKGDVKTVIDDLMQKNLEQLQEQKRHIENQIEDLIIKINSSSN